MDIRRSFEGLLRSWGHDIYLQRKNPGDHVGIYATGSGSGYPDKLERHTVRHTLARSIATAGMQEERPEGVLRTVDIVYYFKWDANPKEGDRIYETDQGVPTPKLGELYVIDYALAMKGFGGRIEYWTVGATRSQPN